MAASALRRRGPAALFLALALLCLAATAGALPVGGREAFPLSTLDALREAQAADPRPAVVLITKAWCGACKRLKAELEKGGPDADRLFAALPKLHAAHLADDDEPTGPEWTPDGGYIPRALFLSPTGEVLAEQVWNRSGNPQFKHYYTSTAELAAAVEEVALKWGGRQHEEL